MKKTLAMIGALVILGTGCGKSAEDIWNGFTDEQKDAFCQTRRVVGPTQLGMELRAKARLSEKRAGFSEDQVDDIVQVANDACFAS